MHTDGDASLHFEKIVLGGLLIVVIYKVFEIFLQWINNPRHLVVLVLVLLTILILAFNVIKAKFESLASKHGSDKHVLDFAKDSVYCGKTDKKEEVWVKPSQRIMHTQIVGTTNAGKTESVIIPWAVDDIRRKRGLIIVDGKADNSLLDKLWAYVVKENRQKDFKLFSLGHRGWSEQWNPLVGGTAEEITERVFNSFDFENPYYRSLQYEVLNQIMRIFEISNTPVSFQRIQQVIVDPELLLDLEFEKNDDGLKQWLNWFVNLPSKDRETRTSGLLTAIGHFSLGANAQLFNPASEGINIDEALSKNQILYFQLPVLLSPFLGKATGKLVLQSLQAAVANRHRQLNASKELFSVYLDDFSEYLYPGFVSILNKSRSANVGVVFAHQALGDIQTLGDPVANSILTNSNMKVFMRGNSPDSAEYFSKVIGTVGSTKFTERQKKGFFGIDKSGDVSAREVEEFAIHPNVFKRELGVGEAIMVIPHSKGSKSIRIKFDKLDDLPKVVMSESKKSFLPLLNRRIIKVHQSNEEGNPFNKS
jgi:type IV secretory pathway TraG/TraD family ATPase VirD4